MAMVFDPISKQWIDDGTGLDASAPVPGMAPAAPAAPALAPPVLAAGEGGAAPGTTIQIGSTKPEHETSASSQQLVKGAGSQAADAQVAASSGAFLAGSAAQEGVERQEGEVRGQAATAEEDARERAGLDMAALEEKRRLAIQAAQVEDDDQIKQVGKAHKEKNDAEIDYFKGRPAAEIFAAILRGVDRAASSFRGETGPTGVDRVLGEKIASYKAMKLGEWEKAKDVRAAKKANSAAYQEELTRQEIAINNKLLSGLEVLRARTEKLTAQLTPDRAAAMRQQRDAAFQNHEAHLRQEREQNYDKLSKFEQTNRSPTTSGAAGKPASEETRGLVTGSETYDSLSARNEQIIAENGGKFPVKGPLAQEFETNNLKMSTVLQKPLGKSDSDASRAEKLQASPGVGAVVRDRLGDKTVVKNYLKALEVNRKNLRDEAASMAKGEGKPGPSAAAAPAAKPAVKPPAEGEVVRFGGKRYRMVKGKLEAQP